MRNTPIEVCGRERLFDSSGVGVLPGHCFNLYLKHYVSQITELFVISSINKRIICSLPVTLMSTIRIGTSQAVQILERSPIVIICSLLNKGLIFLGVPCVVSVRNFSCFCILRINISDLVKNFSHFSIILVHSRLKIN